MSDFWLNCVDALERGGDLAAYRTLDARVETMPRVEAERRPIPDFSRKSADRFAEL